MAELKLEDCKTPEEMAAAVMADYKNGKHYELGAYQFRITGEAEKVMLASVTEALRHMERVTVERCAEITEPSPPECSNNCWTCHVRRVRAAAIRALITETTKENAL